MRHFDLYGKHLRKAHQLEEQAVAAMHRGDERRYIALMNRARDYRAKAHRSARYAQ